MCMFTHPICQLLLKCAQKSIKGFESKKSPEEESYKQLVLIVNDLIRRGKREEEIVSTLQAFR